LNQLISDEVQHKAMNAKTAKALAELGRAAARHAGIPDDVVITMEILPDREYEWCALQDDCVEAQEEGVSVTAQS
jgi:hypothetical protein